MGALVLECCRRSLAASLGDILHYIQGDELSTHLHDQACIMWDTGREIPLSVEVRLRDLSIWQPIIFKSGLQEYSLPLLSLQ